MCSTWNVQTREGEDNFALFLKTGFTVVFRRSDGRNRWSKATESLQEKRMKGLIAAAGLSARLPISMVLSGLLAFESKSSKFRKCVPRGTCKHERARTILLFS